MLKSVKKQLNDLVLVNNNGIRLYRYFFELNLSYVKRLLFMRKNTHKK